MMHVDALDHLVLTVSSIERTCEFYEQVLGMKQVTFGDGRKAVAFGSQKINLHLAGHEFTPRAQHPVPGSADVCFITSRPLDDCMAHVEAQGVEIIEGPVDRTGATSRLRSFYFRDPDLNLIEVANRVAAAPT
ncbi:MAG: VOC family protein [Pseudomonadota bacterium]|nr:VOC family protein [Pseudomonadota bacterium]